MLPQKETDKPVQFWQLRKGNKVRWIWSRSKSDADEVAMSRFTTTTVSRDQSIFGNVAGPTSCTSVATKTPQEAAPVLGRGALCADSMGLGKTLTMLALILATKSDTPLDHSNATLIGL